MPLPAETGLVKFNGWCPFKWKKTSAANWQSKSYRLIPLLTHLGFRRTIPLITIFHMYYLKCKLTDKVVFHYLSLQHVKIIYQSIIWTITSWEALCNNFMLVFIIGTTTCCISFQLPSFEIRLVRARKG